MIVNSQTNYVEEMAPCILVYIAAKLFTLPGVRIVFPRISLNVHHIEKMFQIKAAHPNEVHIPCYSYLCMTYCLDCMADVLMGFHRYTFPKPNKNSIQISPHVISGLF